MVLELKSWVQSPLPPATQVFVARILPSLASVGPVGTAKPEREQAVPIAVTRMQEGECWTIA
jgi:hypothetical protein